MPHTTGLIVYILRSLGNPARHYVGTTDSMRRRIAEHNRGICHTTSRHRPWELVVAVFVPDASVARRFERYLKSGSGRAFAKRHFGRGVAWDVRPRSASALYTARGGDLMLQALRVNATGFSSTLLDETEALLSKVGRELRVEHAVWNDGEFHVTANAPGIASEVAVGDYVYAGFFLAHAPEGATEAGVRIYRVACRNGALADEAEGQRLEFPSRQAPADWREKLGAVVARSFDGGCLDEQTKRLRLTLQELLTAPYEYLLHLRAQELITDDEQAAIQREFDRAGDATLYGLVNAVTRLAHTHRSKADWRRALAVERLGGEIAGGEHQPPVGSPVFH